MLVVTAGMTDNDPTDSPPERGEERSKTGHE